MIFVYAIILICILCYLFSPHFKGKYGEFKVNHFIKKLKKDDEYLIYDMFIKDINYENKTSQIDHILLSRKGIFVIEAKNYSGLIYGSETDKEWMQVLANGKVKNKFYSPILQNKTHIRRLKQLIDDDVYIYNVIIFVQGNIQNIKSNGVYSFNSFKKAYYKLPDKYDISIIKEIYENLSKYIIENPITNRVR